MFKILLVDDEIDILEIMEALIVSEFNCSVVTAMSGNEALEKLKSDKFDIIISDYSMPNGNGGVLFNYNKDHENLPFIFVSGGYLEDYYDVVNFFEVNSLNSYIHKPMDIDGLGQCINNIVGDADRNNSEYSKISDLLIFKFNSSISDIYLKISDSKYVKIKNKNDSSMDEIKRYRAKSSESFYCKKDETIALLKSFISEYVKKLKNSKSNVEKIELCGESIDIIGSSLQFLGLSPENKLLIHTSIETCLDYVLSKKEFEFRFELMLKENGYRISHSVTMASLCFTLANKIGLGQEVIVTKLIQASVLHDSFIDKDLCEFLLLGEDDLKNMKSSKIKEIKEHGLIASKFLTEFDFISTDVLNIIKDHHELPNGSGFPRQIAEANLSGLSVLFNFSLHCADHFFHFGTSYPELINLLGILKNRGFHEGHSEKIYLEFEKLVKKAAEAA